MRYVLAAALAVCASTSWAMDPPLRIGFQGKLTDPATGSPRNGSFTMAFRLYRAPSGGSAVYTETQTGVPVSNGVFSVHIGSTAYLSPDLLAHTSAYLSVEVDGDGEMSPRQHLVMAPYAFTAAQLMGAGDVRVNAGVAYSTFTSGGNLLVPSGVTAATATLTGTGNAQYSLETSSGVNVAAGTLRVAEAVTVGATSAKAVVPSGAIVLFNGACPSGWTEFTGAQGRYLVGVPAAGTAGGTVGTAMTDLDNATHSHGITSTAAQARSGTGQVVVDSLTTPTGTTARGAIAPYVQLRLCIVP